MILLRQLHVKQNVKQQIGVVGVNVTRIVEEEVKNEPEL
jgi:hypothetical protein